MDLGDLLCYVLTSERRAIYNDLIPTLFELFKNNVIII
jgi:hypothetical protein